MYIDLETGTIVNGPVVWLNDNSPFVDELLESSDSVIIGFAKEWGIPVSIAPTAGA